MFNAIEMKRLVQCQGPKSTGMRYDSRARLMLSGVHMRENSDCLLRLLVAEAGKSLPKVGREE